MLKDLITGFKLLKYGYKIKLNLAMIAIFIVIGVVVEVGSGGGNVIGGFYFMILGMFAYQMIISMDVSTYVASSPMQRKLQLTIPVITSTVFYMVIYTFLLIEKSVLIHLHPEKEDVYVGTLTMMLTFMVATFIFVAVCFKYYWLGFILMMAMVFGSQFFMMNIFMNENGDIAVGMINFPVIAAAGYVIIILGGLLEYGIARLLYRKPLSEYAFRGVFKDA